MLIAAPPFFIDAFRALITLSPLLMLLLFSPVPDFADAALPP